MKKIKRITAFVLTFILVLCSVGLPTGTRATETSSNWTVNQGSIVHETSEEFVVETVTVKYGASGGYIQLTEKLTALIGNGGTDGKGFINVVVGDGSPEQTNKDGYIFMQFLASDQITDLIPRDGVTDQGITWYIAGHDTTNGRIDNHDGKIAMSYGMYSDFSKEGYKMAFTKQTDGRVYVRAIGHGVYNTATNYNSAEAKSVASAQTLASIKGVGNATGEDGVYLRMVSNAGAATITLTVAYPKPADFDYNETHWTLSNATILSTSVETWYLDTVTASYTGPYGYVQHNVRHTELIGKEGMDGKGWVNFIVDDGTKGTKGVNGYNAHGYNNMQLLANPNTEALNTAAHSTNTKAISWYLRTDTSGGAGMYRTDNRSQDYKYYTTNVDNLLGAGQRFVFSSNDAGNVLLRGNGVGTDSTYNGYADTVSHTSTKTLSEIVGLDGTTGADGVYVRFETERDTATFPVTVSIFYKDENQGARQNEVPSDLFANYAHARTWFSSVSSDASHYTVDGDDYVMRVPIVGEGGGWIQSTRTLPTENYAVSYDFTMVPKTAGSAELGGVGNLIGTGNRLFYSLRFDADEVNGKLQFRVIELDATTLAEKENNRFILEGLDFSEKIWFNLRYTVKKDSFRMFLNGQEIYSTYLSGKEINYNTIQFFGFFAEGSTAGFDVKNFTITKGTEAEIYAAVPELKESITLHMQAIVESALAEPVRMKFTFKGEDIWAEGVQSGNQYIFSLPNILPQDMGANISAALYVGDSLQDTVEQYSIKQYCMNQLAHTAAQDTGFRTILVAILNYGAAAQTYFNYDIQNLVIKDLSEIQKTYLVNYDMGQASGVVEDPVTGTPDENYKWNAATLGLYDLIKIRFKFTTTDVSNTRIEIDGKIYDTEDFVVLGGNQYYVYTDGIYATDFDKVITATFIDAEGNPVGEQVSYSVNTYLSYVNGLQESSVKDIAQAIYNYGMSSAAYENATEPQIMGGTLYQLNDSSQMNSYVVHTENNKLLVFDGGYERNLADIVALAKELTGSDVPEVEAWFLTHAHSDHVGAFIALMNESVPSLNVKKVYYNLPCREYTEKHNSLTTYDALIAALDKLPEGTGVVVHQGDVVTVDGLFVETLLTVDETANVANGDLAINEASAVYRLTIGGQRVLFLADIYHVSSSRLAAAYKNDLTAEIVQVAHHGSQGAYFDLYKTIAPKACLWPTPQWLWDNNPGTGYDTGSWETIDLYEYLKNECGVEQHYVAKDGIQKLVFPMRFE